MWNTTSDQSRYGIYNLKNKKGDDSKIVMQRPRSGSAPRAHWDPALFKPKEYYFVEADVRSAFEAADKSELGTNQLPGMPNMMQFHSLSGSSAHDCHRCMKESRERGVYGHDGTQ